MLKIRNCTLEDCGHYSCEIMAYVKPGEDSEIECQLEVEGAVGYSLEVNLESRIVQNVK